MRLKNLCLPAGQCFCSQHPMAIFCSVSHTSQRVVSSVFSNTRCRWAASAFHRLALLQQVAYERQRCCCGDAGGLCSGDRQCLGLAQSGCGNGLLGAVQVPLRLRFSSRQVHYVKGLSKLLRFTSRMQQTVTSPHKCFQSIWLTCMLTVGLCAQSFDEKYWKRLCVHVK